MNPGDLVLIRNDAVGHPKFGGRVGRVTEVDPAGRIVVGLPDDKWMLCDAKQVLFITPAIVQGLLSHLAVSARFLDKDAKWGEIRESVDQVIGYMEARHEL